MFLAGEEAARQLPSNIFILGLVAANKLNLGGKLVHAVILVASGISLIGRIPTNGVVSRSLIMKDNPSDIYNDLPSPLPADGMCCVMLIVCQCMHPHACAYNTHTINRERFAELNFHGLRVPQKFSCEYLAIVIINTAGQSTAKVFLRKPSYG